MKASPTWTEFARKQPPTEICLGTVRVACGCDPLLHQAVLVEPRSLHVTACLRCGTVTCTKCVGDDGRYHGNPWHAYWTVPMPPPIVDWLAFWPRVKVSYTDPRWPMSQELIRREYLYYPPNLRVQDAADLARFERQWMREQNGKTAAERLRQLDRHAPAPPAGMPAGLEGFVDIWETLRLGPESDLLDLARKAQLLSQSSHLAVELLWQRPDAFEVIVCGLRSEDEVWQSMGYAMARDCRPGDQRLAAVILEVLGGLSLDPLPDVPGRIVSCGRFEAMLVLIAELKLATPEIFGALASWQRRLLRRDLWLVKYIRLVLQELKGEPPDASALYQGLSGIPIL